MTFPGTQAEKKANVATHHWAADDDSVRCMTCDCRYGSISSEWECGKEIPREVVTV